jgi:DnaK suppressor protein
MTPKKRAAYRAALEKLRREAREAGPARIEPNRTDDAAVGVADEDAQALSEMLQAINSRRNAERAQLIARLDRALRKIDEAPERFGLCEECEEEIPAARLDAVPHAPLCTDCQAERDPKRGAGRRKLTDYV